MPVGQQASKHPATAGTLVAHRFTLVQTVSNGAIQRLTMHGNHSYARSHLVLVDLRPHLSTRMAREVGVQEYAADNTNPKATARA
jgi:hypothetical protein